MLNWIDCVQEFSLDMQHAPMAAAPNLIWGQQDSTKRQRLDNLCPSYTLLCGECQPLAQVESGGGGGGNWLR